MEVHKFLLEFDADEFPQEFGPWISIEKHDPPFKVRELHLMRKLGIIQIRQRIVGEPLHYRLTLKATKTLKGKTNE